MSRKGYISPVASPFVPSGAAETGEPQWEVPPTRKKKDPAKRKQGKLCQFWVSHALHAEILEAMDEVDQDNFSDFARDILKKEVGIILAQATRRQRRKLAPLELAVKKPKDEEP